MTKYQFDKVATIGIALLAIAAILFCISLQYGTAFADTDLVSVSAAELNASASKDDIPGTWVCSSSLPDGYPVSLVGYIRFLFDVDGALVPFNMIECILSQRVFNIYFRDAYTNKRLTVFTHALGHEPTVNLLFLPSTSVYLYVSEATQKFDDALAALSVIGSRYSTDYTLYNNYAKGFEDGRNSILSLSEHNLFSSASATNLTAFDIGNTAAGSQARYNSSTGLVELVPKRPDSSSASYRPCFLWSFEKTLPAGTSCTIEYEDLSPLGTGLGPGADIDNVWRIELQNSNNVWSALALIGAGNDTKLNFTVPYDTSYLVIVVGCNGQVASFRSLNLYVDSSLADGVYKSGYIDGQKVGYDSGYEQANNTVTDTSASYIKGKQDGIAAGSEYSFYGLISAVVDVPVRAFTSLFDFNILGVNLTAVIGVLLMLCFVMAVVRLFMR